MEKCSRLLLIAAISLDLAPYALGPTNVFLQQIHV